MATLGRQAAGGAAVSHGVPGVVHGMLSYLLQDEVGQISESLAEIDNARRYYRFLAEPKIMVAAGLAGGLAYWVVAGSTAGFWKPVFRSEPQQA